MGRGRKGLIEQSERKPKVTRSEGERAGAMMQYFMCQTHTKKNYFYLKKLLKNMNPQQLVDFLLPDDDWYVKTSSGNASGSLLNIPYANSSLFTQALSTKYFMQNVTFYTAISSFFASSIPLIT